MSHEDTHYQLVEIHKQLGRLAAISERAAEDRQAADRENARTQDRIESLTRGIYRRFEEIDDRLDGLTEQGAETRRILLDDVKPQTDRFRQLQSRGTMVIASVGTVGALLGVKFSGAMQAAIEGLKAVFSR